MESYQGFQIKQEPIIWKLNDPKYSNQVNVSVKSNDIVNITNSYDQKRSDAKSNFLKENGKVQSRNEYSSRVSGMNIR